MSSLAAPIRLPSCRMRRSVAERTGVKSRARWRGAPRGTTGLNDRRHRGDDRRLPLNVGAGVVPDHLDVPAC
jgi:hypothetical protein